MRDTQISDYLSPSRIVLDFDTTSRKRLFEHIAEVSGDDESGISEDAIFKTICERERLGSTGLGHGIAVPHGRIANLESPIISVFRLSNPIDYEAPDEEPVWLAIGLLVPEEATDTHLQLFSLLVGCFQDQQFIQAIKDCETAAQVDQLFVGR
ncbi:MAG: PTS sugar transporter subunit IIA [Acidiferrobacterales bacterium]|nr:PTS sugar transporter subunit IIA [Acidiferrobacterales bacterium]